MHLFKIDPKKLWRKILTSKTKENNRIPLKDWKIYFKNIYESHNVMDNIRNSSTNDEVFSMDVIKFRA